MSEPKILPWIAHPRWNFPEVLCVIWVSLAWHDGREGIALVVAVVGILICEGLAAWNRRTEPSAVGGDHD